jgi:alcohol dehydrogenase
MESFDLAPRTRTLFEPGGLKRLGALAAELGFRRALLVADAGLRDAGYVARALRSLEEAGVAAACFHDFGANPDGQMVARGVTAAEEAGSDSLIGLGGGSSMDCAKGIAFLLSGGGAVRDYRGWGTARGPMPPMIGVPTTAGTGSEAQSYALLSDPDTHEKLACGDPGAAFRVALLDPELTLTQPAGVTAVAGFDAITHAVETWVTTKRTPYSAMLAREAWRLLEGHYERVLSHPADGEARAAMLLGAHWAGAAIEASMLGAAHACANPLTARYGTEHGVAVSLTLPAVVAWNAGVARERYAELLAACGREPGDDPAETLRRRLAALAAAGGLPARLSEAGVPEQDLPALARDAAQQWTGRFNPRPFDEAGALEVYRCAY